MRSGWPAARGFRLRINTNVASRVLVTDGGFAPLFSLLTHFSSLDEKVICSHPVWGLWREFGATDRLATGVSGTDKQRQRQEGQRRRREGAAAGRADTDVFCGAGLTFVHQAGPKMGHIQPCFLEKAAGRVRGRLGSRRR